MKLLSCLLALTLATLSAPLATNDAAAKGSIKDLDLEGKVTLPPAPIAAKKPKSTTLHGDTRVDNYHWLREKDAPEVLAYLNAENEYADAFLKNSETIQNKLYDEFLARIKETDLSVPFLERGYYYYSSTEEGKQYATFSRKKGSLEAKEEILLDMNKLAEGHKFLGLGAAKVSDNGNILAYSLDYTGYRDYTLMVKDLRNGEHGPEKIEKVKSVVWGNDNKTIFYSIDDDTKRSYRIYRHTLGSEKDELVFEEKDERFGVYVWKSRSGKFLHIGSFSHTTSELFYLDADNPGGEFKIITPREQDHEYSVAHHGDMFYIRTNDKGRNFRVATAPVSAPGRENWKDLIPHNDDVMISDVDLFAKHMVVSELEGGLQHFRIRDFKSGESYRMDIEEEVYAIFSSNNPGYDTTEWRYSYHSMTTPPSVYDFNVMTKERKLLKQTEVEGGYDPNQYESRRLHATAKDGTKIPISIVYKKGIKLDGKNPAFLTAYGSYGSSYPVTFTHSRVSLLDRGFVCAIAHIRGGGEMGTKWHDEGRMLNKMNTFTDFIAASEFLIKEKYTSEDLLSITGGSAGGLLMGAVSNLRPNLFAVVVNHVPFVDVLNTMLDEDMPLTVGEFEEWGNPKIKEQYEYMKTYCPYTNLAKQDYPTTLVKTSYDDSQVMYWEPAKYVARMRDLKTDTNPLIFKTNMDGGHGGSSGRYDKLKETAQDYAFIITQLGVEE
jgi:oligopeptidase B